MLVVILFMLAVLASVGLGVFVRRRHGKREYASTVREIMITCLGVLLALPLSMWAAHRDDRAAANFENESILNALLVETASNQAILRAIIGGSEWNSHSIGTSFPSATIAESVLAERAFFSSTSDFGLVQRAVAYRDMIEAVRRTLELMSDRFIENGGELTADNLATLDRICRNSLAATCILQRRLEGRLSPFLGSSAVMSQLAGFAEEVEQTISQLEREVRRPEAQAN